MFEIGNSLREARMRRNVDFAQAELATKIRGKYLRALEDEQFDVLPAQTYIKGFLRTYAEYLGLDGQLYVDEYNSRFVGAADEHEPRTRRSAVRPQRKNHRRIETNVVLIALAAIAVLVVVIISAWKTSDNKPPTTAKKSPPAATRHSRASSALLTLTGLRGSTHVAARVGSASGNVAFDGTISKGDPAVALRGRRLWLQIDSPENLRIQVRGRLVHVPGLQPRVIIVTPTGWRPA